MSSSGVDKDFVVGGATDIDWHRTIIEGGNKSERLFAEKDKGSSKKDGKEYMLDDKEMITVMKEILPGVNIPKGTLPIIGMVAGYSLLSVVCPPLGVLFAIIGGCAGASVGNEIEGHLKTSTNVMNIGDVLNAGAEKKKEEG